MNYIRIFLLILFVFTVAVFPAISAQVYDDEEYYKKLKAEDMEKQIKIQQAENQYQSVINKLNRIEELEKKSEELQRQIRKKSYVPRKAREAREEKAEVDKELESLIVEKDSLLKQKEELEAEMRRLR